MISLKALKIVENRDALNDIPDGKVLINTINAHSYNTALEDEAFAEALQKGDYLVPDGMSIVKACRFLKAESCPTERIAGWDLFEFEMTRLNSRSGKCFFMGSSEDVLAKIKERAAVDYPGILVESYSPPYKQEFSEEDNAAIVNAINAANPDLLWIGMTAPKQEKWAHAHWPELNINCHCGTIGAVFDFYAGTVKRAPEWMQKAGLEWLHRLLSNPKRMWRRYVVGNVKFIRNVIKEKI
ncbi:MAG: WecB/TagA/CpsF family glycosyltransferase [Bacteroidales bacterium]|nr:WecB/TagA/CpsF family glycosyltransferase [Bacteroidales bacterium]